MALNYVTLTVDLYDGTGSNLSAGTATFTPGAQLKDTTDHQVVTQAPIVVAFKPGAAPVIRLLATDNSALSPSSWTWSVSYSGVPGNPATTSFSLAFASGAAQNLSSLI